MMTNKETKTVIPAEPVIASPAFRAGRGNPIFMLDGSPRPAEFTPAGLKPGRPRDDERVSSVGTARRAGVTLIEMMLVLVIIAMIILGAMNYMESRAKTARIDRASLQMQQILNAALAYYTFNSSWPSNLAALQSSGYLPSQITNPWGLPYNLSRSSDSLTLGVWTEITTPISGTSIDMVTAPAIARSIAGQLPLSYTVANKPTPFLPVSPLNCSSGQTCYVVGVVTIPGQNLNNATAVNFAGVYRHGGCVPAPRCPQGKDSSGATINMTPQIMVVPASVSGLANPTSSYTPLPDPRLNVYPLTSFFAYVSSASPTGNPVAACSGNNLPQTCTPYANAGSGEPGPNTYWRVCLKISTTQGETQGLDNTWGNNVTIMAITRCAPANEPAGSSFTVFEN